MIGTWLSAGGSSRYIPLLDFFKKFKLGGGKKQEVECTE
jgi:hypothetical protein